MKKQAFLLLFIFKLFMTNVYCQQIDSVIKNPLSEQQKIKTQDSLNLYNSSFKDSIYNKSHDKYLLSDYLGAINDLNKVIELDSTDYEAIFFRGFIKSEYKFYQNNSSTLNPYIDFNEVIKINSNYGLAYSYRGIQKMRDGKLEEALKDCDLGIAKMPNNKFCYFNRGQVKEKLNDSKGAISDFSKVIKIDSNYYPALLYSIDIKEKIRNYNGLIEDYNQLVKIFPDKPLIYLYRGEAKLKSKNKIGACEDFEKVKQLGVEDQTKINKLIKKNCKK